MKNLLKLMGFTKIGFNSSIAQDQRYPIDLDLEKKVFVVTGANSGLGYETTKVLLQMNAHVIIICRNQKRMDTAVEDFKQLASGEVSAIQADLSEPKQVPTLVQKIFNISENIEAVIHNAGALLNEKSLNSENMETTFALMSLSPFLLTQALLRNSKKFIWVSSGGMYGTAQNLSDINYEKRKYDGVMAYAESKRNQVDLASIFAQKNPDKKFYSMHPGWVDTPGVQNSLPMFRRITGPLLRDYYQGADTILYLAIEDLEEGNGCFWFDRNIVPDSLFKKGPSTTDLDKKKLWELLQSF